MKTHRAISSRAGFTLIELLVVIAIVAILAGLLLPALPREPDWLSEKTFRYTPRVVGAVDPSRIDPPEPNQSPLPPVPGQFYELDWSASTTNSAVNQPSQDQFLFAGLGTSRVAGSLGNTFGDFGGSLRVDRIGDDLSLTATGSGFVTLDLIDLLTPDVDAFPSPAIGPEFNQLVNMTPFTVNTNIHIPSTELSQFPTLEDLLRGASPQLLTLTGDPVILKESNGGTDVDVLQSFGPADVPEPSAMVLFAVGSAVCGVRWIRTRRKQPDGSP